MRPRKPPPETVPKPKQVAYFLEPDLIADVKDVATVRGMHQSAIVTEALHAHLATLALIHPRLELRTRHRRHATA
jgi:hypothetical protein